MFEAIWEAAGVLPPEKQARIQPVFLETVGRAGDAALLRSWQSRLGAPAHHRTPQVDYAGQQAKAVVAESGWSGFEQRAGARQPALRALAIPDHRQCRPARRPHPVRGRCR